MWRRRTDGLEIKTRSQLVPPFCRLLAFRQQAGVSSGCRGVHRDDLLSGETSQVVRAARFRAGAGETRAAERLRADHRADHVAVDIDIAVGEPCDNLLGGIVDARVDAEREAI